MLIGSKKLRYGSLSTYKFGLLVKFKYGVVLMTLFVLYWLMQLCFLNLIEESKV